MSYCSRSIAVVLATIVLTLVSANSPFAQISCTDVKYGNPNYRDKMDELAKRARLPDNYWSRYHESVVTDLCSGNISDVDKLVDDGSVKPQEAQGIAKVLGKTYKPKQRSEMGKSYEYSKARFLKMGACSACADNIAQYYTKKPNSPCGELARQALEGNSYAVKKLVAFPDYCEWKYYRPEETSGVRWDEISRIYGFGTKYTELQKRELWKSYKGKLVIWSGQVSYIDEGLLGGIQVQLKIDPTTITSDVLFRLKDGQRSKALNLINGSHVTIKGYLDDWGTIMPITVDEGEIQ